MGGVSNQEYAVMIKAFSDTDGSLPWENADDLNSEMGQTGSLAYELYAARRREIFYCCATLGSIWHRE